MSIVYAALVGFLAIIFSVSVQVICLEIRIRRRRKRMYARHKEEDADFEIRKSELISKIDAVLGKHR